MKIRTIFLTSAFVFYVLICICVVNFVRLYSQIINSSSEVLAQEDIVEKISPSHQILFASNETGNWDIYQMNLSDLSKINLTNNPADDMNPQISPDGKSFVFFSDRDGDNEIYRFDFLTRFVTQLTENKSQDFDPSFSPDGNQIVYKSTLEDKLGDIFIMNSDGTSPKNLTRARYTTEEWDPTFSPDGSRIAFVSRLGASHTDDEIFLMNSDGSDQEQVTNNEVPDWYPSFDSNDEHLLMVSNQSADEDDDLYLLENGRKKRLTIQSGDDDDPAFSSDSSEIIFINNKDGDYDLYIMNTNGTSINKIIDTPYDELSPVFLK